MASYTELRKKFKEKYTEGYNDYGCRLRGARRGTKELGHPEKDFKSVHVTGSKGASSTSAFAGRVLREAGYSVGVFSGTHMVSEGVREKFEVDGEYISKADFRRLAEEVSNAVTTTSEWDLLVLMGLKYFSEKDVDVAVFESGIGGLSDSTNVLSAELAIITNAVVTPNHPELGDTDISVAEHKGGIIHDGTVAVANGTQEVHSRLDEIASRRRGEFYPKRDVVSFERNGLFFVGEYNGKSVETNVSASYLCENMNTALTGLVESPFEIPEEAVLSAVESFVIAGRCEVIDENPPILLDGASNGFSAKVLWDEVEEIGGSDVFIFSGITDDEGWREVADVLNIEERFSTVIVPDCTDVGLEDPEKISAAIDCEVVEDVGEAVSLAREVTDDDDLVLCTGSLFLTKLVRRELGLET